MRVVLFSCGQELAAVDADPAQQVHNPLLALPERDQILSDIARNKRNHTCVISSSYILCTTRVLCQSGWALPEGRASVLLGSTGIMQVWADVIMRPTCESPLRVLVAQDRVGFGKPIERLSCVLFTAR